MERQPCSAPDPIREDFFRTRDADALLDARTTQVDGIVLAAWDQLLAAQATGGLALLAVGGYGRRQLFPYSDVDLLLLFCNERSAHNSKRVLSPFLQRLWDSGLRLSQSVRTVAECAVLHEHNLELNISLLDPRYLAGDEDLWGKLRERLSRLVQAEREGLVRRLARLTRDRHLKFGDTFYHLEPNIKEAPGGLRDYQLLCWLKQLQGVPGAPRELEAARRFLFATRGCLHFQSGRDDNTLSFEAQEWLAGLAGPGDPAAWMREHYRHAREIYRAATSLLEDIQAQTSGLFSQFRDWRSRLSNAELSVLRERVYFRAPLQLGQEPGLALRLFEFVARHGIRPAADAGRRLAEHSAALARHLAQDAYPWGALKRILSLPHADLALRAMHDTGFLRVLFPELEPMECLVTRDFHHRYTVDEHTLVAIQTLGDLRRVTPPAALKPFADLLAELEQPALLAFALLFHDVGKGSPGEGHVDASLRIASRAAARIRMPVAERELVEFLIAHHLDLSSTLHSRDLDDPATLQSLARNVGTVERLKALTLLTYADISAVNPGAMTAWRATQLFRLHRLTDQELTRELASDRIAARPQDPPAKAEFLEGFPTRYLRTHSEVEIEAHFRLSEQLAARNVVANLERIAGAWRLTLLTADRPFLFASIAGTLSAFGMNILKAEAFANRRGEVLDTFVFADPSRTFDLNPSEVDRYLATLERVIAGSQDVGQLLRSRPRVIPPSRGARFEPTVWSDSQASATATLIQIVAEDRPGLLYDLARTMSGEGCSIDVVLIDTEAHKAIDVFYVTLGGAKLAPAVVETLREKLLAACHG